MTEGSATPGPPAEPDRPGSLALRVVRLAGRLPRRVVGRVVRGVDGFYMAFQSALRTSGLVRERGDPPEMSGPGGRFGVLPGREGRWPPLQVRLPPSAVHWFGVESMFRRAETWRSGGRFEEVADFVAAAAHEALPGASERRSGSAVEVRHDAAGLATFIRARALDDGTVVVSVGQRLGRS